MTDNDATRKRHRVADQLRIGADELYSAHRMDMDALRALLEIADEIDREHERRMEQQSYELRKAFCRYMGGVLDDYRHGMKRRRMRK